VIQIPSCHPESLARRWFIPALRRRRTLTSALGLDPHHIPDKTVELTTGEFDVPDVLCGLIQVAHPRITGAPRGLHIPDISRSELLVLTL
jgi:hypothetical protein